MKSGIYRIFNKKNGRSYVGSARVDWQVRVRNHFWKLRKGIHHSAAMQDDWNKVGSIEFGCELLESCDGPMCEVREAELMEKFNALDPIEGYNTTEVAKKGYSGNKRGPKPSGVETAVLYKRLPKEDKKALSDLVDAALTRTIDKWQKNNQKFFEERMKERYGVDVAKATNSIISGPTGNVPVIIDETGKAKLNELLDSERKQKMALQEDVDRLTKDVESLKSRLERCARATEDQKAIYWKNRALKAEAAGVEGEYDQG